MAIKENQVIYEFDPFEETGIDSPEKRKDQKTALKEIAEFVRDELLQYYGEGKTPVSGGEWKKSLSPEYKKAKDKISSSNFANMELYGDMLDSLEYRIDGGKIKIGWFTKDQAVKAYAHTTGFEGHPTIKKGPVRQLLPDKGGSLKRDIVSGMKDIAKEFVDGET